jgi:hypothetical protein
MKLIMLFIGLPLCLYGLLMFAGTKFIKDTQNLPPRPRFQSIHAEILRDDQKIPYGIADITECRIRGLKFNIIHDEETGQEIICISEASSYSNGGLAFAGPSCYLTGRKW